MPGSPSSRNATSNGRPGGSGCNARTPTHPNAHTPRLPVCLHPVYLSAHLHAPACARYARFTLDLAHVVVVIVIGVAVVIVVAVVVVTVTVGGRQR